MTGEQPDSPLLGATVLDTTRNRVGRVMGAEGPYLQLRPLGGGREWDAVPGHLRVLTRTEVLSALVAETNARSLRRRALGGGAATGSGT